MTPPVALHATKSDFARRRVRGLILSGQLEPGTVINRAMLARGFGISTTPLREALRRLVQQGVVDLDAHRRFRTAVSRASHNAMPIAMLDGLWDTADRYRRHGLQVERGPEERSATAREHALLLRAVVEGDPGTAGDVMRAHVETSLGATSASRLADPATDRP